MRYRIGNEVKNNTWLESTIFFLTDRQHNNVSILTKNVTENAESIKEQNVMLQNALNEAKEYYELVQENELDESMIKETLEKSLYTEDEIEYALSNMNK